MQCPELGLYAFAAHPVGPKSVAEAKISKLSPFRAAPVTKRLDPEVQWWLYFVRQRVLY